MRFFHIVAVFTARVVLTTASPNPEESIFSDSSDLSDLSSNIFDPHLVIDSSSLPLGDSTFLLDGSDDGTQLFTQDSSTIVDNFCSAPNGPARKRDNSKCDTSPPGTPPIDIPTFPNLLDLQSPGPQNGGQTDDNGDFSLPLTDPLKILPFDDSVTTKLRQDDGQCLEVPYLENVCCNGPWFARVPGILGTVYSEIRACYYSESTIIFD